MQKKSKPGSRGRPKCKKKASLETEAGQNTKTTQKQRQKNAKQMQKFAVIAEIIKKQLKNWPFPGAFAFFCIFVALFFFFFAFFAFFLRFGRPLFPGLHFFLHFGRPRLPGLLFFAFWSSLGFRCAFVSHFAESRPLQPRKCKKKCKAKFKHASKHKKMQRKIQAGQQTRKKKASSKCKKNMQHKKNANSRCKKTQNL